jgi:hypothetical protein
MRVLGMRGDEDEDDDSKPRITFCEADSADSAMSAKVVHLSSQGLEQASSASDNDFTFVVNGIEIHCTEFEASFISPRVACLLQQDKTINSFFVESLRKEVEWKRVIAVFESLMKGSGIVAQESELRRLCEFAAVLGNTELLKELCDSTEVNADNVCSRMQKGYFCCDVCIEEEIVFAASHFSELEIEELKDLDICILEKILSSSSLRLKDEDSLLAFICQVESDNRLLVRQVFSEYLSSESMSVFLDFFSLSNADSMIWSSLCRRLLLPIWKPPSKVKIPITKAKTPGAKVEMPMQPPESRDGIIGRLAQKQGGNVHEKGIVTITSKSVYVDDPKYAAKNVVDLTSDSYFYSKNEPGQWVCWDFGEMRVRPTHYTIWTGYLQSWVVEGSLDGRSWTEIDRQTDNEDFYEWNRASFAVSNPAEFRFIRLSQTDKRYFHGDNYLVFYSVELFGTLSE